MSTTLVERKATGARRRLLATEGRPLFVSDWMRALFIHYEVDPEALQPAVPFELDRRDGRAYVSLVAFTMRGLRLDAAGRLGAWLTLPAATHGLLNVRTYVRRRGEPGIYFMTEWIPNPLSVLAGPRTYGLPYRLGRLDYRHDHRRGHLSGRVRPVRGTGRLVYDATIDPDVEFASARSGSLDDFLLERYTAFTRARRVARRFRIWHPPWRQSRVDVAMLDDTAIAATGVWHRAARIVSANYSPGVEGVWIGAPRQVRCESLRARADLADESCGRTG